MSFAKMKTMLEHKGGSLRQAKINDGQLLMKHQLMSDPSYRDRFSLWTFNADKGIDTTIPIKVFDEKYSAANGLTILFNTLIEDRIKVGNVLYDSKEDYYWICIESYNRDDILCDGKLVRCNYWMRWQDKNGHIFEYPVFEINSTQYNSGESGDRTMTLASSQHLITVTADENTIAINHGQRMFWDRNIVDPSVFKVTQNDTTAMNYDDGLLKVTVTEDQYDSNIDSIENWLCDYFPIVSKDITIVYSGNPTIRIGGTKTLKVDTDKPVVWNLDSGIGATMTPNGNSVKVKCPSGDFVEQTISVKANVDGVISECVITVTGGV